MDVEGEDTPHAPRAAQNRKPPPPPTQLPPPPEAPCTGTPAEHAEGERAGGDVAQWQQQQKKQLGLWQVPAISAEAAPGSCSTALLEPTTTSGPLRWSVTACAVTATI